MRKGNMTILASILAVTLVALGVGAGTMAWFSDTKTVESPSFVAGTMELGMSVTDIALTDIFPSKVLAPITFFFKNDGSIPGYLYYKITYTKNDNTPNAYDLNNDNFAALIYVESVTYEHYTTAGGWTGNPSNDLPKWMDMDLNEDDDVSLYEMKTIGWLPYDPAPAPLAVGDAGRFIITFHMADSLVSYPDGDLLFDVEDNRPMDDGIDVHFTAVLMSSPMPE